MAVLYRKYRPQTFSQVLNQKAVIQTLKNQVKGDQVAHAYLFTGSRGVGKTSVARILAKAVNCKDLVNGDPCGRCEVCKQIESGNFIDLIEIDAASNTGVDNIRELIEHVKFAPALGRYKVFIIDEVHMLSKGAFNALLKTLEEPPKHVIFILATTEINKVLPTIISRTQRFDFKALSADDLLPHLEYINQQEQSGLNREILELVAQTSEGSARDSLSLLDKVMTLGQEATLQEVRQLLGVTDLSLCEDFLELIAQNRAAEIFDLLQSIGEKGLDYSVFNRDFLEYLRKALVSKVSGGQELFGLSALHADKLTSLVETFSANELIFIIRLFLKSYKDLSIAPNAQIPLLIAGIEAAVKKTAERKVGGTVEQKPVPATKPVNKITGLRVEPVSGAESVTEQPGAGPEVSDESLMTLEEAQDFWPQVVAKIRDANGPLSSLLKSCSPQQVYGSKIVVGVKFMFDKQNLESMKNSSIINSTIESITGKKMSVLAQVQKLPSQDTPSAAAVLTDALKILGGELVE